MHLNFSGSYEMKVLSFELKKYSMFSETIYYLKNINFVTDTENILQFLKLCKTHRQCYNYNFSSAFMMLQIFCGKLC